MHFVTIPLATVSPPSLIANRSPSSIGKGFSMSSVHLTRSPGIAISTSSGRVTFTVVVPVRMKHCGR